MQSKVIEVVAVIVVIRGQRCNSDRWKNKREVTKQKSVEVANLRQAALTMWTEKQFEKGTSRKQ